MSVVLYCSLAQLHKYQNNPYILSIPIYSINLQQTCYHILSSVIQAVPDKTNTNFFLQSLARAAMKTGREYYIGDAFDANWKRVHAPCTDCLGLSDEYGCGSKQSTDKECEVSYHFGIYTSDGKSKGLVIPWTIAWAMVKCSVTQQHCGVKNMERSFQEWCQNSRKGYKSISLIIEM